MNAFSDALSGDALPAATAAALTGSLVCGALALMAITVFRRMDPAWRSCVFGVLLLASLVIPLSPLRSVVFGGATFAIASSSGGEGSVSPLLLGPAKAPGAEAPPESAGRVSTLGFPYELPVSWRAPLEVIAVLWAGGSALGMVWWLVGMARLQCWRRAGHQEAAFEGVPVISSPLCRQPVCAGLLRPFVLIPEGMLSGLSDLEKRALLTHETAHARRGDLRWLHGQWLVLCLNWWNPLLHMLSRRFSEAREELCDRHVVRRGIGPADYAQCLLDIARRSTGVAAIPAPAVSRSYAAARRRMERLLSGNPIKEPGGFSRWACRGVIGLCAALVISHLPIPAFGEEDVATDRHGESPAASKDGEIKAPATSTEGVRPAEVPSAKPAQALVVIDAGHGGADSGAVVGTLREKDLTMVLAGELGEALKKRGVRIVMTRSDDRLLRISDRTKLIAEAAPHLMVSLHANSGPAGRRGPEIAYPPSGSTVLASALSGALINSGKEKPVVQEKPLGILRDCPCPAALVECGYITDTADRAWLTDPAARAGFIEALASGVTEALDSKYELIPPSEPK